MSVGHTSGLVNLYDIRYPKVLLTITHKNRMPIKALSFSSDYLLSCDFQALKISHKSSGEIVTTIESESFINDFEVVQGSGLVFIANETQRIGTFYIPLLGNAPK